MEKTIYKKIIKRIVNRITMIIGPVAIMQANTVKGLHVTASGDVDIQGDPAKKIEQLIKAYEVLIGSVAITIAKKTVKPLLKKNKGLKIPKKLQ